MSGIFWVSLNDSSPVILRSTLRMTRLNISFRDELSSQFERCLNKILRTFEDADNGFSQNKRDFCSGRCIARTAEVSALSVHIMMTALK
jgi:hypothetical protein